MNDNITLKAKVYNRVYSDKAGSLRRSLTDGAALPHTIKVAHTEIVDSVSKLKLARSLVRIDMSHLDTGGVNPAATPVTAYMVVTHGTGINQPTTAAIELAVDSLCQAMVGTGADASALDLAAIFFANKEQ